MLSFDRCTNKCIRRAQEGEALIGFALMIRKYESYSNAAQGCFRGQNGPDTFGIRVDFIIH